MTNESIGAFAAFAAFLALASGARAKWQTNADRGRTVSVKAGETWRLYGTTTRDLSDQDIAQYRLLLPATGVGDVVDAEVGTDRRSFVAVVRYAKDTDLAIGAPRDLAPGVSITLTNAEKV